MTSPIPQIPQGMPVIMASKAWGRVVGVTYSISPCKVLLSVKLVGFDKKSGDRLTARRWDVG